MYGAGAEYALHSLLNLAARKAPASVRDLADFQGIPERFLAKLFSRLRKAGIVAGTEGIAGGFVLARPPERITFLDVLEAVDPGRALFECAEIRRRCDLFEGAAPEWATKGMCRIHAFMNEAEQALKAHLASKTLADIIAEFERKAPAAFAEEAALWFRHHAERRIRRQGTGAAPTGKNTKRRSS
jgi:Rrf2 family protein